MMLLGYKGFETVIPPHKQRCTVAVRMMKSTERHWAELFGYTKEDTSEKKDANLRTVYCFHI